MNLEYSLPPRRIVVCCDGTGNQFEEHNTNVVKMFRVLLRDSERQIAYYDPGVGTFSRPGLSTPWGKKLSKWAGLAAGYGLTQNLEEAYRFLMDRWRPGDELYFLGFSRGALTVRALAGMIHRCGLLEPGCHQLVPYVSKMYRATEKEEWRVVASFKKTFGRPVRIRFLGLFDTVSTLGFVYSRRTLPNTAHNLSVATVRHALAIDERRAYYQPNRWWPKGRSEEQDVVEVWFAGAHSDVGGGYPEAESGLSKVALDWMLGEAVSAGLLVDPVAYRRIVHGVGERARSFRPPDPHGPRHLSLRGGWRLLEALPKNYTLERQRFRRPPLGERRRLEPPPGHPSSRVLVHESVVARVEAGVDATLPPGRGSTAYDPALPPEYGVVATRPVVSA